MIFIIKIFKIFLGLLGHEFQILNLWSIVIELPCFEKLSKYCLLTKVGFVVSKLSWQKTEPLNHQGNVTSAVLYPNPIAVVTVLEYNKHKSVALSTFSRIVIVKILGSPFSFMDMKVR